MRARLEGEPGLLALRKHRGRKVNDVVDDLAVRLDVDDLPRLKRYYQQLEGGVLDPHPIDERVWEALRDVFSTSVRNLIRPLVTRQGGSAMAYYRTASAETSGSLRDAGPPEAALVASPIRHRPHGTRSIASFSATPEPDARARPGGPQPQSGPPESMRYSGWTRRRAANVPPTSSRPAPASPPTSAAVPASTEGSSSPVPESTATGALSTPRSTSVASSWPTGVGCCSIPRAARVVSSAPGIVPPIPRAASPTSSFAAAGFARVAAVSASS